MAGRTRKIGRFMWSIVGTSAVKQRPSAADDGQVRELELEQAERLAAREHDRDDRDVARRQQARP
jgi:hypothetical protein